MPNTKTKVIRYCTYIVDLSVVISYNKFINMSLERNPLEPLSLPYYFATEPTFYVDSRIGKMKLEHLEVDRLTIGGELQVTRSICFFGPLNSGDIISSEKKSGEDGTFDLPFIAISSFDTSLPIGREERLAVLREIANTLPDGGYYLMRGKPTFDTNECEAVWGPPIYATRVYVEGDTDISKVFVFKNVKRFGRRI